MNVHRPDLAVAGKAIRAIIASPAPETFFLILARWPREIRMFTVEHPMLETEQEALGALRQTDHAIRVLRCDPDCAPRDVSEDLARLWLADLQKNGFDAEDDFTPRFLIEHLSEDEIYGGGIK